MGSVRRGLAVVALTALGAWAPQPVRGLVTVAFGIGGPTWAFGLLARRVLGLEGWSEWALGAALTLVAWSMGMMALLATGLTLSRPEVVGVLAAEVLSPLLVVRRLGPPSTLPAVSPEMTEKSRGTMA